MSSCTGGTIRHGTTAPRHARSTGPTQPTNAAASSWRPSIENCAVAAASTRHVTVRPNAAVSSRKPGTPPGAAPPTAQGPLGHQAQTIQFTSE